MENIIGIPILTDAGLKSQISDHFGKAPYYLLYNMTTKTSTLLKNTSKHFGGSAHPPVMLKDAGVHVVIAKNIGEHAKEMFDKFNIKLYVKAENTAEETLKQFLDGKLKLATSEDLETGHTHTH
jgi:predicted Fe-Mo cluster-binding NifX family protein